MTSYFKFSNIDNENFTEEVFYYCHGENLTSTAILNTQPILRSLAIDD